MKWVRTNPMMISGLVPQMGAPPKAFVKDYFEQFHATAAHLWITGLPKAMDGWRKHGGPGMRFIAWTDKNGISHPAKTVLGGYGANPPGRIGYQIGDEPRTWDDFLAHKKGVDAVRQADPGALLIFNFTYHAKELDKMLEAVASASAWDLDVLSYDAYSRSNKSAYWPMEKVRAVALKHGKPYWRYLKSYYKGEGGDDPLTESDLRWDAFKGLVYGYTGHSWFLYQIGGPAVSDIPTALFVNSASFTSPKAAIYPVVAQINKEMQQLGRAITQLTSTDVSYIPAIGLLQPKGTKTWSPGAGGDPYVTKIAPAAGEAFLDLLAGNFRDDTGDRYVMVQNVRHSNGSWPIDNSKSGKVLIELDFAAAPPWVDRTRVLRLNKVTGQVDQLPLTPMGGAHARLELILPAGDAILFKYATGRPFVVGP